MVGTINGTPTFLECHQTLRIGNDLELYVVALFQSEVSLKTLDLMAIRPSLVIVPPVESKSGNHNSPLASTINFPNSCLSIPIDKPVIPSWSATASKKSLGSVEPVEMM